MTHFKMITQNITKLIIIYSSNDFLVQNGFTIFVTLVQHPIRLIKL